MPTCKRCEVESAAGDLERHERSGVVIVHCPDCGCVMGTYNGRDR